MEKTVQKRQNLYPPGVYGYIKLCSSESHTLNALGLTLGSQGGKQIYYSCPTLILRGRDLKSLCFLSCFMCLIIPSPPRIKNRKFLAWGIQVVFHWKDWCWSWSSSTLATPDAKGWLIGKDPDAGKDWRQEKGMTEDEMVGWHHWLSGHEFEQAPGNGDGQGSLACCRPWGHNELDTTERLNWTNSQTKS